MATAKQLYQLQEVDLEIESGEHALNQKISQLGDKQVLERGQSQLASEQQRLENLRHQQRNTESEVDDLMSKIAALKEKLYSGKVTNPKELSGLQHEITTLKANNDQLETKALEIIDQVEAAEKSVAAASNEFKELENEWSRQQQKLSDEIAQLKIVLADLKPKRQQISGEIAPQAVALYEKLRQQKKPPVTKVEQGICRVCRISLSASESQRVRSGELVLCSSCGRILFLP